MCSGTFCDTATVLVTIVPPCDGKAVTINMNAGASGVGTAGDDVILGTPGPDVINAALVPTRCAPAMVMTLLLVVMVLTACLAKVA